MKTFELNKNAKLVMGIIEGIIKKRKFNDMRKGKEFNAKDAKIRFTEITKWGDRLIKKPYDESVRRGLKVLVNLDIIFKEGKKKSEIRYQLNPKYLRQAFKIGRQNSDITNLQSFPFKDVINLNTTGGKTTIYGLPEEVFHKSSLKDRSFDYSQKETFDFQMGIKSKDVLGEEFGFPQKVKVGLGFNTTEKELMEKSVEYHLDLIKKGARRMEKNKEGKWRKAKNKGKSIKVNEESIKDMIKSIIESHRNSKIAFNNLGENISNYLVELKREHRRKRILESYNTKLKELSKGKVKTNLTKFKKGFVGILAHTDYDEDFLKRSLFEFYGEGVGGYAYNQYPQLFWSFHKFINSLKTDEKQIVFDFLWGIFKENIALYPTRTTFICRAHSHDAFLEGIPLRIGNK